jgi:hypothetical protein
MPVFCNYPAMTENCWGLRRIKAQPVEKVSGHNCLDLKKFHLVPKLTKVTEFT